MIYTSVLNTYEMARVLQKSLNKEEKNGRKKDYSDRR